MSFVLSVRLRLVCFITVIALGIVASSAFADITPGSNWEGTPDPWANYWGNTSLGTPVAGGDPGGWLRITFADTGDEPDDTWSDIVYTKATNIFAATCTTQDTVAFSFWQSNVVAGGLSVRWKSSTNANIWSYTLTPSELTGGANWETFTASFNNWASWAYPFASQDQYLADLQSMDWIGVFIYRNTGAEQIYGVDNFMLTIPEPAEYILLAAAVIASGISLRRRRRLKYEVVPNSG